MTIEDKIDVLFYLFGICMILWILRVLVNIKKLLIPNVLAKCRNNIADLDSKGRYNEILDCIDRYIEMYPGETEFIWSKGVALYKLHRLEEAHVIFHELSCNEPDYKISADRYISSIGEKEHA